MAHRNRFSWPAFTARLAAALIFILPSSPVVPHQVGDEEAWLKSGDPCYPSKQNKKYLESMGVDSSYIHCVPLTVEVLWEAQEIFHHHAGLGTSRAKFSLRDKFPAFLELVYVSAKSQGVKSFQIQAPAPCCPGSVDTQVENADVVLVVCNQAGKGCKPFASSDPLHFKLEAPTDTALGITWDEDEGPHANLNSTRVQFNEAAIPEPFRAVNGVEVLDGEQLQVDSRSPSGFLPEDIDRLLKDGEVQKVFADKLATAAPGLPVSGSQSVKATVKLLFTSDWEKWRVTLQGWSLDDIRSPIRYTQSGAEKKIPMSMEFTWNIEGEFVIRNPKKKPVFDSGQVTKAAVLPRLIYSALDLFQCTVRNCEGTYEASKLAGASLSGTVSGTSLTLSWPKYDPAQCVNCRGKKMATEKVFYREKFTTSDFMRIVSNQPLTLKSGFSVSGKTAGWMTYTITLKKIQ